MKYILLLSILTLIVCQSSEDGIGRLSRKSRERLERIKSCVNENGSEELKNVVNVKKDIGIKSLQENVDLTEDDIDVYKECRHKAISMIERENVITFRERNRKNGFAP